MPINNFCPDFIKKYQAEQKEASREPFASEERQENDEIEKRNEEILSKPELINEHYIDGEQKKLLNFLKEHNFKFNIYQDTKIAGEISYKIVMYGTEIDTGNKFLMTAKKNGEENR